MIKRLLLVAALALSVGGCADTLQKFKDAGNAITGTVATAQAVRVEIASFNAYEALADGYNRLRLCNGTNGPICRDPAIRKVVRASVFAGRSARDSLLAYLRASCRPDPANPSGPRICGESAPQATFDQLVSATNVIKNSLKDYQAALH